MRSKLRILILIAIFLISVSCGCGKGRFTKNNPCDTRASPLSTSKFVTTDIARGKWKYYYLPLKGLGDSFELNLKMDGPPLKGFINFQRADQYKLPTDTYADYFFQAQDGDIAVPLTILTYGWQNRDSGKMLLGIENSDNKVRKVQIKYTSSEKDQKMAFNKLVIGTIIVIALVIFVVFCLGVYINRRMKRRRAMMSGQIVRIDSEAQGILIIDAQSSPTNVKSTDAFTLEEFQKYFPKKSFERLENQFQQTGCSVCLEDFAGETLCYQLYCNHIFHEECIQQWLEKQNNCPACRVPLGKRAIEEFLEAQKKQNEVEIITPKHIRIQGLISGERNNQRIHF